jgi:putative transposase
MLAEDKEYSTREKCELLTLNRSGMYYKPKPITAQKLAILHRIDEIYTKYPYYGSRRIRVILNQEGYEISRPTVSKYMNEMGLEAIYPKRNLSIRNPEHKVYPYLLRHISAKRPNHIWGTDITYIRLKGGFMYLVVYMDWYSRFVVSWELSDTLDEGFVISALRNALEKSVPEIANSDQGSQFTGKAYTNTLLNSKVAISMDGRKRALDNIFTERLWRTVKYENIYIHEYESPRELRMGLNEYFTHYNHTRPHQALGYQTPADVYFKKNN